MKHNKNHDNALSASPPLVPVRFEFTHPTANTVVVAGSFNHWQPESKSLHPSGVGHWFKETALPPGTYEYAWWWMVNGCPTRLPENPCPTRLAGETRF